jgi:two-component system, NtrC family, sensor histidine kinase KinB
MTLKRKMLLGYGFAFALMAMVMVWAAVRLSVLGRATDSILRQNYRSIDASWMMSDALDRQNEVLLTDTSGGSSLPSDFVDAEADFLFWLGKARDNVTVTGEESAVAEVGDLYSEYLRACATFRASFTDPARAAAYASTVKPGADLVDIALSRLHELNQEAMYSASGRAMELADGGMRSTIVIGGIGLAAGILFSILLSGRILRPLHQTIPAARRLAAGDYSARVPGGGRDELGLLAREFNAMAAQLEHFESLHVDSLISEKSKTEAILNGIDDGIVLVDPGLGVLGMNPASESLLGAAHVERSGSRRLSELISSEKILSEALRVAGGAAPAVMSDDDRTVEMGHHGERRWILFSAIPLEHKNGPLPGCVVVLRDVTRTREAERIKSEFVMAAAHELRTPVTSIGMSIDLLAEHSMGTLEPRERELLESAREESHRLKSLINDLLDLSRIEAGRIDLSPEAVPVKVLFERVGGIFETQITRKQAILEVSLNSNELEIFADPGKAAWVLTNLVSNALRYIPEKDGRISLSARRIGDSVQLSVSDNGPGIPLDRQSRIFQKFVHFDVDGRTGGSGLGLAICREVVRASGGTIWVESEPGAGTTFVFTFPSPQREDGN